MKDHKDILLGLLQEISRKLVEAEPMLTELDSKIGDGDCGVGLKRGFSNVLEKLPSFSEMTMGNILKQTGMTLVSSIGGTSGAIFGTGFMKLGAFIGDRESLSRENVVEALETAYASMVMRGENTQVGDKTLIDALRPGLDAFETEFKAGADPLQAVVAGIKAAQAGSDSTIELVARKGRASYLGQRSKGHRDAGSAAIVVIFEAARDYLAKQ